MKKSPEIKNKEEVINASRTALQDPISVEFWAEVEQAMNDREQENNNLVEPRI